MYWRGCGTGEGMVLDVLLKRQLYWTWCNTERILDIHSIEDSVIFGECLCLKLCRISVLCRRFKSTVVLVLFIVMFSASNFYWCCLLFRSWHHPGCDHCT